VPQGGNPAGQTPGKSTVRQGLRQSGGPYWQGKSKVKVEIRQRSRSGGYQWLGKDLVVTELGTSDFTV